MSAERIWANSAVAGLLLLAALLIFPNLDDRRLWDDEAETALLARNTLRFGVPIAWDGVNLISQECGTDYDSNYLWRQTVWDSVPEPDRQIFCDPGNRPQISVYEKVRR